MCCPIEEEKCDISDKGLAKWRDGAIQKIKFEVDAIKSDSFWKRYMDGLNRQSTWDFICDRFPIETFPLPDGF